MFCNIILVIRKALQICFSYAHNSNASTIKQIKNRQVVFKLLILNRNSLTMVEYIPLMTL